MSVALYNNEEICALWQACGGEDELRDLFVALAYANRAAYLLSYGELDFEPLVKLEGPREDERYGRWARDTLSWADNLLYNCVSNGGADFAPPDRANKLRAVAYAVQHSDAVA